MSTATSSNNKRIARNTLLLYVRMFLTMAVGLYTSRVVLQTLGASDYGIYNVVGGFVMMLAYMNSVFVSASQRYLSFFIGKGDSGQLHRVFCTSMSVHCILGLIIFLLAETFGLWFVNNYLAIDPARMEAANWVFQCSILVLVINIIAIPYNSSIVAHEHMNVFAYISIIDVVMKLAIVYMLIMAPWDKLITYSILMVLVTLLVSMVYVIYCRRHFSECHYSPIIDRERIKEMSSYAGWTAVGTLGFTFKDQALNIILNLFFGTTVNAARGIAVQANGIVNQFATNFFMAVSPQIIKQYASGDIEESRRLVYSSAKFAFFLMGVVIIPLLLNLRYLLLLWLGDVPEFTYEFLSVILVGSLIATLASSTTTALQATGDIRNFQIAISILFLIELPLAYLLLRMGYSPYIAVLPSVATQFLGIVLRFLILSRQIEGYNPGYFLTRIVLRSIAVISVSFAICAPLHARIARDTFLSLVLTSALYATVTAALVYAAGLTPSERGVVNGYARKLLAKPSFFNK